LPLVETTLRILPRCTVVTRTLNGVWRREEYKISKTTIAAKTGQNHRRRDGACELFVNANLFFFQGPAGIPVSINLPFGRPPPLSRTLPPQVPI
jgi:hypothetical protein